MKLVNPIGEFGSLCDRLVRFGMFDPALNTARMIGVARWGPGIGAMVHASAIRWPNRTAIIDDAGDLSYLELDRQAAAIAGHLGATGNGGPVGILCRNHRGFVQSQLAVERSGRDLLLLSTALPAGRLGEIAAREGLTTVLADTEFRPLIAAADLESMTVFTDDSKGESWSRWAHSQPVWRSPRRRSDLIMLTSGTTGPPKGARRRNRALPSSGFGLIDAIPYRLNDVTLVASPLYHAWGLTQSTIALGTGSTLVLQRKFDPVRVLELLALTEVTVLAVVPVMLRRLLAASPADLELPSLRLVASSGNVLSADLAGCWMDRFGPNLYNVYGSTETAIASIASPDDLRAAPGTVGRAPQGVTVAILDDEGLPVGPGEAGRVFTANGLQFDGYTDGSDRSRLGSLMATGDLGFRDVAGRLFIDGRENDLIVTGGENVFPSEVEEVLERHPAVEQVAVVGVPDDEFGQRVAAFVVLESSSDLEDIRVDLKALIRFSEDELGRHKRPRDYQVVQALPMTTTGKVMRHKLSTLGLSQHV